MSYLTAKKTRSRIAVRVPTALLQTVRGLALLMRSPMVGLMQALVIFGAILTFHGLKDPERLERFKTTAKQNLSERQRVRPRGQQIGRRLVTMRLAPGIMDAIAKYGEAVGRNRSDLIVQFLELGTRAFTESQLALAHALQQEMPRPVLYASLVPHSSQ